MSTNSRTAMLEQLKAVLPVPLHDLQKFRSDEWYLVKWLDEYNWNLEDAKKALRKAEKWREENNMNTIILEEMGNFRERFPYENDAVTKDGLPILLIKFGKWNIRETIENGEKDQFLRYSYQMTDRSVNTIMKTVKKTNGSVTHVIIIFDMEGYSFRQLMHRQTISTLSEWTKMSELLYPQQLKTMYIVNAPKIMPLLFGLLKPFMSENTVSRVTIYDSNKEVWQKVLLQNISSDQLSPAYGGTKNKK